MNEKEEKSVYDQVALEFEQNKQKMRDTLGYSFDEFNLEDNLKPSINFAEELMHLIEANLEPFESIHLFSSRKIKIQLF